MTDLISSGKVRAIGASRTRFRHHRGPVGRGIEREILPSIQRLGMGALVWGPLGQGLLTGRVRKNQATTCAAPAWSATSPTNAASTSSNSSSRSPSGPGCQ